MFDQALINLIKTDAEKGMSALLEQYTGLVYTVVKIKYQPYAQVRILKRL